MGALTKKELLERTPGAPTRVDLPDGTHTFVRVMTGDERDEYWSWCGARANNAPEHESGIGQRAKLTCLCCTDEHGERLFTHADMPYVGRIASPILDAICEEASRINILTKDDVEEEAKNSSSSQSNDSGCSSQELSE